MLSRGSGPIGGHPRGLIFLLLLLLQLRSPSPLSLSSQLRSRQRTFPGLSEKKLSRSRPIVALDEPAQPLSAAYRPCLPSLEIWGENSVPDVLSPMGTFRVVVAHPRLHHVIHLRPGENDEVVQAFSLEVRDKRLHEGIRLRSLDGNPFGPDAHVLPELPEVQGELRVVVEDEHARLDVLLLHPHGGIPGLLHHPRVVGIKCCRATEYPTAPQMDEDQAIGVEFSSECVDGLGEKVSGHEAFHVRLEELSPGHRRQAPLGFFRRRMNPVLPEDALDRAGANDVTELFQFPSDASEAPEKVLLPQADDQPSQFLTKRGLPDFLGFLPFLASLIQWR